MLRTNPTGLLAGIDLRLIMHELGVYPTGQLLHPYIGSYAYELFLSIFKNFLSRVKNTVA